MKHKAMNSEFISTIRNECEEEQEEEEQEEEEEEEEWDPELIAWADHTQKSHTVTTLCTSTSRELTPSSTSAPTLAPTTDNSYPVAAAGDAAPTAVNALLGDTAADNRFRVRAKAGMEGMDAEHVNRIVMEASRGSPFYENEQRKAARQTARIEAMLAKARRLRGEPDARERKILSAVQAQVERQRRAGRTYVHIDMDCFYAAVETRDNPRLAGRAMAIGGSSMLSTSNYEARKYGVRAAMPGYIAKKLCPHLIIVPTRFHAYRKASQQFKRILADYDPDFRSLGLDEATVDLTDYLLRLEKEAGSWGEEGTAGAATAADKGAMGVEEDAMGNGVREEVGGGRSQGNKGVKPLPPSPPPAAAARFAAFEAVPGTTMAERVVLEIRQRICEATSGLTASAGLGPNPRLAKICSDRHKPNGQYRLPCDRETVLRFMNDLPVRDIPGIGKVSERTLAALGVTTCGEMRQRLPLLRRLHSEGTFTWYVSVALGVQLPRNRSSTTDEPSSNISSGIISELSSTAAAISPSRPTLPIIEAGGGVGPLATPAGERKSLSHERTFQALSRPSELRRVCAELVARVASDATDKGLVGNTVTIKLKQTDFIVRQRQQKLPGYSANVDDLEEAALTLLDRELATVGDTNCGSSILRLRLMGVRLSGLCSQEMAAREAQIARKRAKKMALTDITRFVHRLASPKRAVAAEGETVAAADIATAHTTESVVLSTSTFSPPVSASIQADYSLAPATTAAASNKIAATTGSSDQTKTSSTAVTCPLCGKILPLDDNAAQNTHLDLCLNRRAVAAAAAESDRREPSTLHLQQKQQQQQQQQQQQHAIRTLTIPQRVMLPSDIPDGRKRKASH